MDDEQRWSAVTTRDGTADTGWVYGVRTTGVFCRPGCPSRRPRRENVAFFASAAEAEGAGFRACRRCRPDRATAPDPTGELVAAACRALDRTDDVPTLASLAAEVGTTSGHLQRVFTERVGVSPRAYADQRRARRLAGHLEAGAPVAAAAHDAGFGSLARASAAAPGRLGMTPSRFRAGGAGEQLRVAVAESSLGPVLVAATERGVCAVDLGDDPDELLAAFAARFHAAEVVAGDADFEHTVAAVVAVVDGTTPATDLPLDVRGTAFQERVWQALRAVPSGTTVTYAELAAAVGAPGSARAVAAACAANPVAVVVPCHRVVRTDGGLAGYRWGVARKRDLLASEARRTTGV